MSFVSLPFWMEELQAQTFSIAIQGRNKVIAGLDTIKLRGCNLTHMMWDSHMSWQRIAYVII